MEEDIEDATELAEEQARSQFEEAWHEVVGDDIPEYRIMIWGSVIEPNRRPTDVDLIFEYAGEPIDPDKENSVESIVKSSVYTDRFSYLDPMVAHYSEVPSIISRSRVSRIYSIDEEGWVNFD